ncbi:hypothetical protein [Kitasatospora sp. NPDC059327]|uniref:hypothetical protein n=1 Tax=Kitasatospora sp. NPDC059327 TaxID=3346803 RepID=UPI0036778B9D
MSENSATPRLAPPRPTSVVVPCLDDAAVLPATYERLAALTGRPVRWRAGRPGTPSPVAAGPLGPDDRAAAS